MKTRYVLWAVFWGVCLTISSLLLLTSFSRADPGIYYVRAGASGDCSAANPCGRVQQAIDLATTGDQVLVAGGIYTENLEITHSVGLRGGWNLSFTVQSPVSYPTTIEGSGAHNVRIEDDPLAIVTLDSLTLRNGRDGIHVWAGNVTVERCLVLGAAKQGLEIDGGTVIISATQILTAQQGIEVDDGVVQVTGVHIAHTSEEGLLVEGGGTVTFTASTIEDCSQQGIQVDKGNVWLSDNIVRDIRADGVRIEGGVVSIVGNTVHATLSDGLDVSGTQTIANNLVYDTVKRGIYAHDGALTLLGNTVHDTGGDGIRTDDGLTVTLRSNSVYSAGNDGIDARGERVIVTGNTITGCTDNGLKVDEVIEWAQLNGNWGLNNPVGLAVRSAPLFTLTNNVLGDSITTSLELSGAGTGFIYHNTLVGGGSGLLVSNPLTATLANNIIVSHSVGITATPGASLAVSRTLLWGNGSDPISGTGVITQAPAFVAPAAQDYHIRPASPAVDAGIEVGVSRDVDGDPRLGSPDLGADEVVNRVYLPAVMRSH